MDESLESTPPRGSRLGKVRRRVLLFLLVVVVLVAFVPTILSTAALRQFVLSKVVPAEVGTATAEQLSLGWLTGIDVQGVVLTDTNGQKVFEADRLTVSRSLMNLAMDRRDLGEIRIHSPKIYVVTTANGSNLEDLLTTVANLPGDESSSGGGPEYKLTLDEGEAYVADPELGELWRIEDLQLVLNHPAAGGLEVSAIGHVGTVDPQKLTPTGPRGDAKLTLVQKPGGEQEAELNCHNLPLAAARPWLRRWDRNIQLTGVASGEGEASWQVTPGAEMSLATVMANSLGRFDVTGFRYQGLAVGQRQLDLPTISMPWNVSIAGGQLTAKQLRVETGAGTASATGVVPIAAWSDRRALLAGTRASIDGDVSLPELTRLAPELIPLRQGAQVTAGNVRFRVRAEPEADALRVAADLETTSLAGQRQGKTIEWNAPLRVHVAARQFDKRVLVESANINSDFARLTLTGDRQQMRAEGSFDLNELSQRLGEFVDLGTVRLAGTGSLSGVMQLDDAGRFTAGGGGKLQDLVVSDSTRTLVAESLVDWNVNCQGLYDWDAHLPKQFASGQLTLVAGNDEMTADLTGETQLASSLVETVWPIKLRLVGDVTNWQRRLEPFLALKDWALAGRATVTGEGRFRATPLRFALTTSQLNIEQLVADSPDYSIREPQVRWSGDLEFDRATGTLASKGGQLVGSTVSAGFRDLMWTLSESATTKASGELAVRTDLARLAAWQKSKPSDTSRLVAKVIRLITGKRQTRCCRRKAASRPRYARRPGRGGAHTVGGRQSNSTAKADASNACGWS